MSQLQQMIEETVAALTALDANALERLKPEIEGLTAAQVASDDLVEAMLAHRLLGALLQETERNLRLFRVTSHSAQQASDLGCYASPLR